MERVVGPEEGAELFAGFDGLGALEMIWEGVGEGDGERTWRWPSEVRLTRWSGVVWWISRFSGSI